MTKKDTHVFKSVHLSLLGLFYVSVGSVVLFLSVPSAVRHHTHAHAHTRMHARSRVKPVEKTLGIWLLSGTRTQKTEKKGGKRKNKRSEGTKPNQPWGLIRADK